MVDFAANFTIISHHSLITHCSLVLLIFKGTALAVFPVPQPQPSQYSHSQGHDAKLSKSILKKESHSLQKHCPVKQCLLPFLGKGTTPHTQKDTEIQGKAENLVNTSKPESTDTGDKESQAFERQAQKTAS